MLQKREDLKTVVLSSDNNNNVHKHIVKKSPDIIGTLFLFSTFVFMYFFRKRDPNRPTNFNLRVMHIINAIAITMFLAGIIYKLIDWFILK